MQNPEIIIQIKVADFDLKIIGRSDDNCEVMITDTSDFPDIEKSTQFNCNSQQVAALLSLLVCWDGEPPWVTEAYNLIGPLVEHLPQNLRPIP